LKITETPYPLDIVQKAGYCSGIGVVDQNELTRLEGVSKSYPAREELGLLAKCANPSCAASFRYLQEGTLFRFECEPPQGVPGANETEYFWLCPNCTKKMILRLDATSKIRLVPQPDGTSLAAGSAGITLPHGKRRLRLSYPMASKSS
jgi:hypothetical protein